ncbi:MAG: CaiB/BaiF CoA-transferase family protein [Amphritea sp.]
MSDVQPLDGIKVIDFTQVMLGPCATQMLADFGADVIKVERPKHGDLSRGVFGAKNEASLNNPVYCSLNRNKRSIDLDTRTEAGKKVIYELVRTADVVVSNFRPDVMERMGFGYEALRTINPGIIFALGSGFGLTGPNAHKGGQDVLAQAMTGVMEQRADASIPRAIYPTALCDYSAGMHMVQGILAAIIARMKTGEGQMVEVSLYDSMIAMQMQEAACIMANGMELNWAAMPLTGVFNTSDGAIVIVGAFKMNPLQDLSNAMGVEDYSLQYPDLESQTANKPFLQQLMRDNFGRMTTDEALARLEEQDLLCAPVRSLKQAISDEQTRVNEMIATIDHPLHGEMKIVASPIKMSGSKFKVRRSPPKLGQHTEEILSEIGMTLGNLTEGASA